MKYFYWFILSNLLTLGLIATLQFVDFPLFFLVLVAMHMGVILFILSKRGFKKLALDVKREYLVQDILLALYLPILGAKILSRFGWIEFPGSITTMLVLTLTGISYVITVFTAASLYKKLHK